MYDSFFDRHSGLCFIAAIVCIVISALCLGAFLDSTECHNYGQVTNRKVEWLLIGGCFVQSAHGMVPKEEFTARAITHQD